MRCLGGILGREVLVRIAIGLGLALTLGVVDAAAKDYKYIGVKKCRSCHKKELIGDQYGQWREGVHARAYQTLKGKKALEIAKQRGIAQARVALAWLLTRPGVTAPIVGATKLPHLEDAIASVELELSDEEIQTLEAPYQPHAVKGLGAPASRRSGATER